jgi:hypothetical protein
VRLKSPRGRHVLGIHVVDTEARTLDEALEILEHRRQQAKSLATRRANAKPRTIKQELATALLVTRHKLGQIPYRTAETLPHPFKDLPPREQAAKVREMYDDGHGYWGTDRVAFRRLAKAFGVTYGQIVTWIENPGKDDAEPVKEAPRQAGPTYMKTMPPLDDQIIAILGRPHFTCRGIVNALRGDGYEIPKKAEDEQATAIYWLLGIYLKNYGKPPPVWVNEVRAELKRMTAKGKKP